MELAFASILKFIHSLNTSFILLNGNEDHDFDDEDSDDNENDFLGTEKLQTLNRVNDNSLPSVAAEDDILPENHPNKDNGG